MVIAGFSLQDKLGRVRFFEETFLLADTRKEVVLGMPSSTSPMQIYGLQRRSLNAAALPATKRVELIDRREFVATALNADNETFMVHVAALEVTNMVVHPSREAQIGLLKADEAPTNIPAEYSDYVDVFSPELAAELP